MLLIWITFLKLWPFFKKSTLIPKGLIGLCKKGKQLLSLITHKTDKSHICLLPILFRVEKPYSKFFLNLSLRKKWASKISSFFHLISRFYQGFLLTSPGLQVFSFQISMSWSKVKFSRVHGSWELKIFLFEMTKKKQIISSLIARCDLENHSQLSFYISSTYSLVHLSDSGHCLLPSSVITVTFEVLNLISVCGYVYV